MKNIRLFLLLGILSTISFSCSNKENKNSDWKKLNLNTEIESITEKNYDAIVEAGKIKAGNKTSNSDFDCIMTFNKKGFIVQKKLFNFDETVNSIYMYEYNKYNYLTKTTKYNAMESIDKVFVAEYDEKTNEKKTETTYTALGTKEFTDKYFYQNKLESKQETYIGNGMLYCKWEYGYDKNGNKIKEKWFINNSVTQTIFQYNSNNQLIIQEEMNQDNISTKWKFEYDENGNMTKETCIFSDNNETTRTYEYSYDNQKNWIKKITLENGQALFITNRIIKYY